jgi:hypothetical protein
MNRTLMATNVLLGIIAVCLLLLVASVYGVGVREAQAKVIAPPQEVILMYWDNDSRSYKPVATPDGTIRTSR